MNAESDDPAWRRRYPVRPFVAASVAVVRDGRVLLAARGQAPMRGVYTLPGGQVEAGETLAEAALRELHEEVGVVAEIVAGLPPLEVIGRDAEGAVLHHFVIHPHAARWRSGEPTTGPEALALRWVTPEEAHDLPTTEGLHGVIALALATVGNGA
ncbi:NUDIX hydrolase [Methylobacterium indicum]|uniref:NUDIX hydrolase n=1 Tax=Methylobacterium indicum TaxID=1775910 RepID=UPI000734E3FC|nr:NUDIX hydrolase [Methylobacterium indicum]KTS38234.1 NUDIX hydrolase [Methylobacterium indicum]KTS38438.1 NUDIX hydrolase [Methylobacterium indicum]KTS48344.1 NUDIX hydrolase [Methylobacterium indicum]